MTQEKPIRLLHVMAGAETGGAETFFHEAVVALAERPEIVQHVITRPFPHRVKEISNANVPITPASFNRWMPFATSKKVRKTVDEFQPDLVQYWMGRAGSFSVPEGPHKNIAWYGGYYDRKKRFSDCSHHIVVTHDLKRHVIESGEHPDNVDVLHTTVKFDETVKPVDRASLSTPEDAPVLLALARLHWKKGFDVLLKSLVDVPGAYLWIAGEGPLEKPLKKLATDLNLNDRVRFLGWRNDRDALLKACDIVVFPSRYEPFGTVMVDAWVAKKPLIAADAQGPAVYVKDGQNGLLVPKDDVEALRDAILKVMNNTDLSETIVKGGSDIYQQQFTKQAFQKASLDVYTKIFNQKNLQAHSTKLVG